jgi:hypothetical protein
VCGRWRLLDPSRVVAAGGFAAGSPSAPFFCPPEAFVYDYYPLESQVSVME